MHLENTWSLLIVIIYLGENTRRAYPERGKWKACQTMRENIESLSSKNERQQMDWKKKESLRAGLPGMIINRSFHVFCRLVLALWIKSYLRQQAQNNLQRHKQQNMPESAYQLLAEINQVLKFSLQIAIANESVGREGNEVISSW